MTQPPETSRFVPKKIETEIWANVKTDEGKNQIICHGYDFYNDILGRYSASEIFFLLIKGELPTSKQATIMNLLMTSIINPGPKDWSTVAAMTASVSHTTVGNSLIAGISALQSRYNGGLCVEKSMQMFLDSQKIYMDTNDIPHLVNTIESAYPDLPGYGRNRSEQDERAQKLKDIVREEDKTGEYLNLALEMEEEIHKNKTIWLTTPGVVSAILLDLGFEPRDGHGIFIVSSLPGILSHILAQMKKGGWNTFPFYDTPKYNPTKTNKLSETQKVYGGENA